MSLTGLDCIRIRAANSRVSCNAGTFAGVPEFSWCTHQSDQDPPGVSLTGLDCIRIRAANPRVSCNLRTFAGLPEFSWCTHQSDQDPRTERLRSSRWVGLTGLDWIPMRMHWQLKRLALSRKPPVVHTVMTKTSQELLTVKCIFEGGGGRISSLCIFMGECHHDDCIFLRGGGVTVICFSEGGGGGNVMCFQGRSLLWGGGGGDRGIHLGACFQGR